MLEDIRHLRASEVEARVGQVFPGRGVSLLLYKDARCDMAILDEAVGPTGWQRSHEFKDGRLYCTVSVWDGERGGWVSKEDVGSESNMEADKGQASDAFKRACVNWGIGRELYTAPFMFVPAEKVTIVEGRNGRPQCRDHFDVSELEYDDAGRISAVSVDVKGERVFSWRRAGRSAPAPEPAAAPGPAGGSSDGGSGDGGSASGKAEVDRFMDLADRMRAVMGVESREGVFMFLKAKFGVNGDGNLDRAKMPQMCEYMQMCVTAGALFEEVPA